jgi:hypothetical protein
MMTELDGGQVRCDAPGCGKVCKNMAGYMIHAYSHKSRLKLATALCVSSLSVKLVVRSSS